MHEFSPFVLHSYGMGDRQDDGREPHRAAQPRCGEVAAETLRSVGFAALASLFMSKTVFMRTALDLAREGVGRGDGGPFGAVVVQAGTIVGEGWNRVLKTQDPTAHAEMVAIRDACARLGTFDLSDCEIYASSEPCPMCLGAIYWSRLARIYYCNPSAEASAYGFRDDFIYAELRMPPEQRTVPTSRVAIPGGMDVFDDWRDQSKKHGSGY